jgi:hypothetical protein
VILYSIGKIDQLNFLSSSSANLTVEQYGSDILLNIYVWSLIH